MSDLNSSQAEAIEKAKGEGFKVIRSSPKRLLVDLDSKEDIEYFEKRFGNVYTAMEMRGVTLSKYASWKSKSGKGKHQYISIVASRQLSIVERLLLEVSLGSDRQRAFLSLMRYWDGNNEPGTLFKPAKPEPPKKPLPAFRPMPTERTYSQRFPVTGILDDDVPF